MSRIILSFALFFTIAFAGDCAGTWSSWGPCDGVCGAQSVKHRWYSIQVPASSNGAPCPFAHDAMQETACTVLCSDQNCVGAWSAAGPCVSDGQCGSAAGKATRTYHITTPQGPGGEPCPAAQGATTEVTCSAPVTPCRACEGHFIDTPCVSNGNCGSNAGTRTRTYQITQEAETGGAPCPFTHGQVVTEACTCPVTPCVDCVGHWETVGACVSNGVCNSPAGIQQRRYVHTQAAGPGGAACPRPDGATDQQPCQCPQVTPCIDCQGTWSAYTQCQSSGQCGSDAGTRQRTFTVTQQAGPGGRACEATNGFVETSACAAPVVPCVGCEGSWSGWGECLSNGVCSSSAGRQSRTYTITNPGEAGGAHCPRKNGDVESRACECPTVIPCAPEDCEGSFGALSTCRITGCGSAAGTQSRTFTITKQAKFGGKACLKPHGFVETVDCECPAGEVRPCPVDCVGHFEEPSACISAGQCSSDLGHFTERYVIDVEAAHNGKACPFKSGYIKKTRCKAEVTPCPPENCVGKWTTTECRANLCGSAAGQSKSTFTIISPAKYGGLECECPSGTVRKNVCECPTITPCPVDCQGEWTENTPCASKGKCSSPAGTTERTYVIKVQAAHGGRQCPFENGKVEKENCNTAPVTPCPPEHCEGAWAVGKCVNTKCDTTEGLRKEVYAVTKAARYGGRACEAEHEDKRSVICKAEHVHCPIDCVGAYKEWSTCEAKHKCGSTAGTKERVFAVTTAAAHGGKQCVRQDKSVEHAECKVPLVKCPPEPCVGGWSAPTPCKQTKCDDRTGTQVSTYQIQKPARHEGTECPAKDGEKKTEACQVAEEGMLRCPRDCVGKWTDFSQCKPLDCGCPAGRQERQYHIESPAMFGGRPCPEDDKSVHERNCQAAPEHIKRCPNALLDAPCEDLTLVLKEAKDLRCKLSGIYEALKNHK